MSRRMVLLLAVVLLALLATGCQGSLPFGGTPTPTATPLPTSTRADEVVIPFETIAVNGMEPILPEIVGAPAVVTRYGAFSGNESQEPSAFLLTSPVEISSLPPWLPPETLAAITAINFGQNVVLIFFAGLMGGGSDAYIDRIAMSSPESLRVYGIERRFSSGTTDITLPSHVVQIRRQDLPYGLSTEVQITIEMRLEIIYPFEE